jgi:hypothetical protein
MQINILNTDQKKLQKRKPKKEDMKAKRSNTILSYAHSLNQAITSSLVTLDVHASLGFFFFFFFPLLKQELGGLKDCCTDGWRSSVVVVVVAMWGRST